MWRNHCIFTPSTWGWPKHKGCKWQHSFALCSLCEQTINCCHSSSYRANIEEKTKVKVTYFEAENISKIHTWKVTYNQVYGKRSAFWRQRQDVCEFVASLVYIASFWLVGTTQCHPFSNKQANKRTDDRVYFPCLEPQSFPDWNIWNTLVFIWILIFCWGVEACVHFASQRGAVKALWAMSSDVHLS